jgi:hypothetical protein
VTIRSINELLAQADATIEDNTTGAITPADVRNMFKDFLDTIAPAYGAISLPTASKALSPTPSAITPFTSVVQQTANVYLASAANGNVRRLINTAGIAGATDFVVISGTIAGGNNNTVRLTLYKNGAPTPYTTSVTCTGAGDFQGFNLAGITYTDGAQDATYAIYASGPAGTYDLADLFLVAQAQPVRSFV